MLKVLVLTVLVLVPITFKGNLILYGLYCTAEVAPKLLTKPYNWPITKRIVLRCRRPPSTVPAIRESPPKTSEANVIDDLGGLAVLGGLLGFGVLGTAAAVAGVGYYDKQKELRDAERPGLFLLGTSYLVFLSTVGIGRFVVISSFSTPISSNSRFKRTLIPRLRYSGGLFVRPGSISDA